MTVKNRIQSVTHGDNVSMTIITVGAIEIEPGKHYIIESPQCLSEKIKDRLKLRLHQETGATFSILEAGIKIARPEINS